MARSRPAWILSGSVWNSGVSVGPGQTQLTLIWYRAISRASDLVNAMIAPLVPAKTVAPVLPTRPASEAILTILTVRPASTTEVRNAWHSRTGPRKFTVTRFVHSASSLARNGSAPADPAAWAVTSGRP